jgi:hypothetical protein
VEAVLEDQRRGGIDVIIVDIPRPGDDYASDEAINVTPTKAESSNGHKAKELPPEDPRPKD